MLSITDNASLERALSDTDLGPDLRALIGLRAWQLHIEQGRPWGAGFRLVVIEGGETPETINAALGFDITGDHAEPPSYDWLVDHGLWFEIAYETGLDRVTRVLVRASPAVELGLSYLCISHFWTDDESDAS
ncbi:hypothetical protein [Brevundimonas sp. TWP2-3-2]|uniref:hypothetical protein n=1 Tax=unclassified Brevundimonas TaxID=2622653 RepID=UPI003CFA9D05